MKNIMYIHGLGGTRNGRTGKAIKEIFEEKGYLIFTEEYDINPDKWILKIQKDVKKYNIDIVIASSLGAFMSLYALKNTNIKLILINPALDPKKDLESNFGYGIKEYRGKREDGIQSYELSEEFYRKLENLSSNLLPITNKNIYGIFSRNDEFFHHFDDFKRMISNKCILVDDATHHFTYENIKSYVVPLIKFTDKN